MPRRGKLAELILELVGQGAEPGKKRTIAAVVLSVSASIAAAAHAIVLLAPHFKEAASGVWQGWELFRDLGPVAKVLEWIRTFYQ